MVVLVDTKYYGAMLRRARQQQNIKRRDAAKIFKISLRELSKYERGQLPIPDEIMMRLLYRGFCLFKCQKNI